VLDGGHVWPHLVELANCSELLSLVKQLLIAHRNEMSDQQLIPLCCWVILCLTPWPLECPPITAYAKSAIDVDWEVGGGITRQGKKAEYTAILMTWVLCELHSHSYPWKDAQLACCSKYIWNGASNQVGH